MLFLSIHAAAPTWRQVADVGEQFSSVRNTYITWQMEMTIHFDLAVDLSSREDSPCGSCVYAVETNTIQGANKQRRAKAGGGWNEEPLATAAATVSKRPMCIQIGV